MLIFHYVGAAASSPARSDPLAATKKSYTLVAATTVGVPLSGVSVRLPDPFELSSVNPVVILPGALAERGEKPFRAKQLSTHYFERLVDDPEQMTDLPAAQRAELVEAFLPDLMTPLVLVKFQLRFM